MAVIAYTTPAMTTGISGEKTSVRLTFKYNANDPVAFLMLYRSDRLSGGGVEWIAALSLLVEGLEAPAGLADVQVWPESRRKIAIRLESEVGSSITRVPRMAIESFLKIIKEEEELSNTKSGDVIALAVEEFLGELGLLRNAPYGVPNPGGPSQPGDMCNVCGRVHSGNGCGDY